MRIVLMDVKDVILLKRIIVMNVKMVMNYIIINVEK